MVDDEQNLVRVLDYVLEAQGYEIITADNGAKALENSAKALDFEAAEYMGWILSTRVAPKY